MGGHSALTDIFLRFGGLLKKPRWLVYVSLENRSLATTCQCFLMTDAMSLARGEQLLSLFFVSFMKHSAWDQLGNGSQPLLQTLFYMVFIKILAPNL